MNVIYKTLPRHTEEKVPLDQIIEIHFMIDINKSTIKPEGIILLNLTEQIVEPVSFSYNRRVLKIDPVSRLLPKNHYQLQILGGNKGLKDITGRIMAQTYEVEFYTKDVDEVKPPRILSPVDVSIYREPVTFQLEPNLDVDYYELQVSKSNTFHNVVWPISDEKVYRTPEVTVTPDIAYVTGSYYMRVRSVDFEGKASSWSETIRYYYDGAPVIQEMPEEPLPDGTETTTGDVSVMGKEPKVSEATKKVVLKAMSQLQHEPNQLSKLQDIFSATSGTVLTGLYVKSAKPKDKSVNNNVEKFNDTRDIGNKRQIVIEFTEDIDPATVTSLTCYVLAERN